MRTVVDCVSSFIPLLSTINRVWNCSGKKKCCG